MQERSTELEMFQPDVVLPEQYIDRGRSGIRQEPEFRLAVAVLEDAIDCIRKHAAARDRHKKRLFREAEEWVASDERDWPFSFVNICDALGLDPDYVRIGLRPWRERRRARSRARAYSRSRRAPSLASKMKQCRPPESGRAS